MLNNRKLYSIYLVFLFTVLFFSFHNTETSAADCYEEAKNSSFDQLPIQINYHSSDINIKNLNEIIVVETLVLQNIENTSLTYFEIWLEQTYRDLIIEDDQGELGSNNSDTTGWIIVYPRSELGWNQTSYLRFSYILDYEIIEVDETPSYYFQFSSKISYFTQNHDINIFLPNNTFIHTKRGYDSFAAGANVIPTESRLQLSWQFEDLEAGTEPEVFVLFGEPLGPITPIWILVISPLSALLCGIGITLWIMKKKQTEELKKIGEIYLTKDQSDLLKLISEKGGKLTQKELVTYTGLSKSKISRDLNLLEEKDFVKKQRWGRQYRIYLTETGEKVIK